MRCAGASFTAVSRLGIRVENLTIFDRFSRTKQCRSEALVRGFCKMDCGYRAGRTKTQRVTTGRICWVAEPKEIKLVRGEAFQRQGRPYCAVAFADLPALAG